MDEADSDFKIWKKNSYLLYSFIHNCVTKWPSLTCCFTNYAGKDRIILGTHSNNTKANSVIVASCRKLGEGSAQNEKEPNLTDFVCYPHSDTVNKARCHNGLIATQSADSNIYIYDINYSNKEPLKLAGQMKEGYGLSWNTATGNQLLSASYDKNVYIWSGPDYSQKTVFSHHSKEVAAVDWNPSKSGMFASVGDDRLLCIWDSSVNSKPAHSLEAHPSEVNAVAFSPFYENFLITTGSDESANLWDMRNLVQPVHVLMAHEEPVWGVAWSPCKSTVLATNCKSRVNIWDLSRIGETQSSEDISSGVPELIFSHAGHKAEIFDFAWSLDDPWTVCSVSDDNVLQLWQPAKDILEGWDDYELVIGVQNYQ